jgi:phosphoenolpyruvate carboxykinase (ATP)
MNQNETTNTQITLETIGIENAKIKYQLTQDELQKITIESGQGLESDTGALVINTGEFTGRSPKDRFIVKDPITQDQVWWGEVNIPFAPTDFDVLYTDLTAYLSNKELFVHDAYVCADPNYRLNIRV